MNHPRPKRPLFQAVAVLLLPAQVLLSVPVNALAAEDAKEITTSPSAEAKRTPPSVEPPPLYPVFSAQPTESEIFRARVFAEPLVPLGLTSPEENKILAAALTSYLQAGDPEAVGSLTAFLAAHPNSAWRAALLTNLGVVYRGTGYFTKALAAWGEAWRLLENETEPNAKAIGDRAVGELAELNARLGRFDRLEELFADIAGRDITGSATEKIAGAKQGLWLMRNRPGEAFRCGPMAIDRILAHGRAGYKRDAKIMEAQSTLQGTSLSRMQALASSVGLSLQMAKRVGDVDFLLPAMVHWKAGHFAAVLAERGGRYLVQDPTFGDELWISRRALHEEATGYFLVPEGALPQGWQPVTQAEGAQIWGKGVTNANNIQNQKACDPQTPGSCNASPCPMAQYSVHLMLVNLHITDSPVGYSPPRGPSVELRVTYNQREAFQPQIFFYSNLGPKWTFDWLSYIEDNPGDPNGTVYLYVRGGGQETYSGFNGQSYSPHVESRAVLYRISSSPIRYERRLPDGSVEEFTVPDGASSFPRKVFMTKWKDAQGSSLDYTYDASLRLVAATDAISQVTTLSYEDAANPLRITKVTDPFGRFAIFEYNPSGRLKKITDVIGITSEFGYDPGDFITALTTPYGRTTFTFGEEGRNRWLEATDPAGGRERVEYVNIGAIPATEPSATVPTGFAAANGNLHARNTFYWDKRATALYPGDYTKARIFHWLHDVDFTKTAGTLESEKLPLENRVWYAYPGQSSSNPMGTSIQPITVARVLDDGSSQIYRYEYGPRGNVTKITDPVGRETVFEYDTNDIDLLRTKQKNGAGYDLLETRTYNSQHLPLTATDVTGQTTTYTYNAQGQLLTVTTPPRAGITENRTTTYNYDTNGYLQSVTGPATGATTTYTYDGYGRVRTVTDSDGYAVTTDYDALDRPTRDTYPDGTYEETVYNRLDSEKRRDRLGRWTHVFHDALRRVVAARDPMGQAYTLQWCTCGSLEKLVDPNGNATTWERDLQGRVTRQIRADGSDTVLTYESTTSRLKEAKDAKQQIAGIEYFLDNDWKRITYTNAQQPTPTLSFTYDSVYNRLLTMTDGTGTTTYAYSPITGTPTLGAGRLASVDGPLSNDLIAYSYDELGRLASQTIGGVGLSQTYDVLGRTETETNPLGAFGYSYLGTTGRLNSVSYPNGQSTTFGYLGNLQDHRLQEIHNKLSGGATLSRFQYGYDAQGTIKTWTQQTDSNPANAYEFQYDPSNRLTDATLKTTDPTPTILKRYRYSYDKNENRTGEQIDDASLAATLNNLDQLVSHQPGGALRFAGTLNEAATVSVQGQPAQVTVDNRFDGSAQVGQGTSNVAVTATDPSGNARTNTYQVNVSGSGKTFTHDANGNLTGDGTRTFEWEANNRLTAVVQGTHRSEFTYDGWGHRVRIVEKDNSVVTSDRRFLWCGMRICEERDGSGATVVRRFYGQGMQEGGVSFFYTRDHLESIREMTDGAGSIRARYDYDPYGRVTKVTGDKDSVYAFTDHLSHSASGLALAPLRAYDPALGRWLSPDPIGLAAGPNLYGYVGGQPINFRDPLGLQSTDPTGQTGPGGIPPWLVPVTQAAEAAAAKAAEAAGIAAGTAVAACLVVIAAICQTGDGHPPEDPQIVPPTTPPGPVPPTTPTTPPGPTPPPPSKRKQRDPVRYEPTNPGCDSSGNCKPCPPNQAWQAPGNAHGSTTGTHWHWITWNQDPRSCMCYPNRGSGPNKPPWAD